MRALLSSSNRGSPQRLIFGIASSDSLAEQTGTGGACSIARGLARDIRTCNSHLTACANLCQRLRGVCYGHWPGSDPGFDQAASSEGASADAPQRSKARRILSLVDMANPLHVPLPLTPTGSGCSRRACAVGRHRDLKRMAVAQLMETIRVGRCD